MEPNIVLLIISTVMIAACFVPELNVVRPMGVSYFDPYFAFHPYPEGAFVARPSASGREHLHVFAAFVTVLLPLIWVLTNVQELFFPALIYSIIYCVCIPLIALEFLFPMQMKATAMVGFGEGDYGNQIVIGITLGTAFALLGTSLGLKMGALPSLPEISELFPMLMTFFFSVGVAPFLEEWFFGNIVTCSLIKHLGYVPGVIASGIIFASMHFAAYNLDIGLLMMAFLFRVVCSLIILRYTSFLPNWVAHTTYNLIATLISMGVRP